MGVPKFFRYISERYPCLSEVVREYQIPEFDNLYLDMNGIIHQCSHPDDGNVHFRITEEKIFRDVFHYIEVLFRMIKPRKLFFMAVDGVAPRAKMNQQRGRRFRSAKEAEKRKLQAMSKGESLPEEESFDSNCITPGTVFMAKLHEQLKYFVTYKISNDPLWQKCKVILSGHETPGEGEHKIMDYIRYMRSQPDYNPNTRHCLYGLDADLIMLGLCTHEPHFSLLREEVKFGRKNTKRISVPEEIKFYLLHLSLMREYLELEFGELKEKLVEFHFDLESIIDDWVLMGFLVGNDFIPHLPNLHIANGALHILYKAYLEVLPSLDGYINENGKLNLARFQKFMEKLSSIDMENFEETRDDIMYMQQKTGRKVEAHSKVSSKPIEESDDAVEDVPVRDSGLAALIQEADLMCLESDGEEYKYPSDDEEAFSNFKREYYQNKLEYSDVTPEVMRDQAEGYVRAIQWNLNYYYNGCCSWSWFYPHHYAPYISDIKDFSALDIQFDYGVPFLPFEQLLAVLPPLSKNLLPNCYHELMVGENSLLSKYYPENFESDLNGKRQEWEAVVLVPFIDETLLLSEMKNYNTNLSDEERCRNSHGPMSVYSYTQSDNGLYEAPEYFPSVIHNHTRVETMLFTDVLLPEDKLIKGAHPKASKSIYYPGFPTMRHLKYTGELRKEKLKIFESPSRNENMIVKIIPDSKFSGQMIPVDLLGTNIFVNWPQLIEAKVVAISNANRKYVCMGGPNQYDVEERTGHLAQQFKKEVEGVKELYEKRMGVEVGEINVLVHVQQMIGKKYIFTSKGKLVLEKQFAHITSNYPLQAIVYNINVYSGDMEIEKNIDDLFPVNSVCFTLTNPHYGSQGRVEENLIKKHGRIKISVAVLDEPDFSAVRALQKTIRNNYRTLHTACSQLSISHVLFSRITGSVFVTMSTTDGATRNANIGLDLKFNKRNTETPGYTKKIGNTWFYTDKAIDVVRNYSEKYPEVFDYMSQDVHYDNIPAEKLFGDEWEKRIEEVQGWLRNLPCYSLERQTCGVHTVESEVIEEVERTVRDFTSTRKQIVTMQIKPNVIYIPEIQTGTLPPDPKVECQILDRVVNVRQGFTVPFGLKGTIVCIHESPNGSERDTMYDVVFDKPFENGMRMSCSEDRCYRLPKTAFINISYGKRLLEEKTGKPKDLIAEAENFHRPSQGFQNNFMPFRQLQQEQTEQNYFGQTSAFAQFNHHYQPDYYSFDAMHRPQQEFNKYQKYPDTPIQRKAVQGASPKYNKKPDKRQEQGPSTNNSDIKAQQNLFLPSFAVKTDITNGKRVVTKVQTPNDVTEVQSPQHVPPKQKEAQQSPQHGSPKPKNTNQTRSISDGRPKKESAPKRQNQDQTKQRTAINTQFLKDILGIKPEDPQTKTNTVKETKPLPKNNEDGVNVSFDQLAQVANIPASIRLLTYYQSNGLGLPRYHYISSGNSVEATIKLSDGKVITGKPGCDRDEAAEHVAVEVLERLTKNMNQREKITPKQKIPVPPQSWIKSENTQKQTQKEIKEEPKGPAPIDNKAFVPLQVFKNQIKSATKEPIRREEPEEATIIVSKDNNDQEKKPSEKKSFQPRKVRIAANFNKMKE